MNTKTDNTASTSTLDVLKWLGVILVLGGGVFGFYYFEHHMLLVRVIGLLGASVLALLIASRTQKGRSTLEFIQESHLEVRKVVWPSRQETTQMTGLVLLMVIILSLIIWGLDSLLMWLVRLITQS